MLRLPILAHYQRPMRNESHSEEQQQQQVRPVTQSFVKPLRDMNPLLPCRFCKGTGKVACENCEGSGSLPRGGYHKRNPVDISRSIGSKWTAMERTFGWRHFEVRSKQRGPAKEWFLEMVASCDQNTRFWINSQNLKDRGAWSMGWLQKTDMEKDNNIACKTCKGEGEIRCQQCHFQGHNYTAGFLDIIDV